MGRHVIVPWSLTAAGDGDRCRAFRYVLSQWADSGYTPHLAMGADGDWSKADAIAPVVATVGDPVVVADADVWMAPDVVDVSWAAVASGAAWSIPHGRVHRLTQEATSAYLNAAPLPQWPYDREPYVGVGGGGLVVVRRDVALDVPMDRLFVGWGGEDHSWGYALATLWGDPHRPNMRPDEGEPLTHLWHPAPHKATMFGSVENRDRRARYRDAYFNRDRDMMRTLVEEGRPARWPSK